MVIRSLMALMAAIAWLSAAPAAWPADTIEVWRPGASQPEVLAVQPLAAPVSPMLRSVPRFSLRLSVSGSGDSYTAVGVGGLQAAGGSAALIWQLNQLSLGGRSVQGKGLPLALVTTRMDGRGAPQQAVSSFPAYFEAGGANLDTRGADYLLVRALSDGLSAGWGVSAGKPVAQGQPAFDANRLIAGFLAKLIPGTAIVKPLPKGTAVGMVGYQGKQALVARFAGQASLRNAAAGASVTLTVDGFALIDVATALPVYTDSALTFGSGGAPGTAILQTYVDY